MQPVITVNKVSKKYSFGTTERYLTLRESITAALTLPWNKRSGKESTFWALHNVSFKVMPGEILGIVGANGAGKSTILKILSRITCPTSGTITIRGKAVSLLEIGTGFNNELSGRENIFLNGAILGMKRAEIKKKFDEIVAFSGVEKFIDTPVKHYSSGMYVRLAFAIAAHLDADILFVDEILSVGDIEYQRKSLSRMEKMTTEGKTVIFVSHNLDAIGRLCNRALYLQQGRAVSLSAKVPLVIARFLKDSHLLADPTVVRKEVRLKNEFLAFAGINLLNSSNLVSSNIIEGQPFKIVIHLTVIKDNIRVQLGLTLTDDSGRDIATSLCCEPGKYLSLEKGENNIEAVVHPNVLAPGLFGVRIIAYGFDGREYDNIRFSNVLRIAPIPGSGISLARRSGVVNMQLQWKV